MEGVPRIPMLVFPLRRNADNPPFKSRLSKFISLHYGENGESYNSEFHELESLRSSAVRAPKNYSGLSLLKKYYCQLEFLKSRFPLEEGSPISLPFSWIDPYTEQVHTWSDIRFEIASVLYNIGVMHTQVAGNNPRTTVDDMKNCVTYYQCAAWAFETLQKNYPHFATADLNLGNISIMGGVCLAQAQECVVEKSLIDNRRSVITAKLLVQIVDFYKSNSKAAEDIIQHNVYDHPEKVIKPVKLWKKLMDLKILYYSSLVLYFRGQEADDQKQYGHRLAFFREAKEGIESTLKLAKSFDKADGVHATLGFVCDVIIGKCVNAEKENELIYHEKVPSVDSIDGIKGVCLVKPIPLKVDDPEVSGKDIFNRLVPIEAHTSSSLYSEEKAKLLRTITAKILQKNEILDEFLAALQLEQLNLHSNQNQIDQKLVDRCAEMNANGKAAVKKLVELMSDLSGKYLDVEETLKEVRDILMNQDEKDDEYRELIGNRPPCAVLIEVRRDADKFVKAQGKASESNEKLRELVQTNIKNLKVLMQPLPDLVSKIPTVATSDPGESEVVEKMKRLSAKVDEMKKQREAMEKDLREALQKDDITNKIVTTNEKDLSTLFKKELTKHQKQMDYLDQNLLAQDNILRALTETNAHYAETRERIIGQSEARKMFIEVLVESYDEYHNLVTNIEEAVRFYQKFKDSTSHLLSKLKGIAKVQDEEREAKLVKLQSHNIPYQSSSSNRPKLKDYLGNPKNSSDQNYSQNCRASSTIVYSQPQIFVPAQPQKYGVAPPVAFAQPQDYAVARAIAPAQPQTYPGYDSANGYDYSNPSSAYTPTPGSSYHDSNQPKFNDYLTNRYNTSDQNYPQNYGVAPRIAYSQPENFATAQPQNYEVAPAIAPVHSQNYPYYDGGTYPSSAYTPTPTSAYQDSNPPNLNDYLPNRYKQTVPAQPQHYPRYDGASGHGIQRY